jgi:hypothetical protein
MRKLDRDSQRACLDYEEWRKQVSGGLDAKTPRGTRPDQYDRMGNQKTSPAPARNGSPSYPSVKMMGNRPNQGGHEIERSGVKTWASERVSRYTGPDGTNNHRGRGPIRYEDKQGGVS